jgi:uncharacterized protein YegP (UPF0339 family)
MQKIKIYIDHQTTRSQYRVRLTKGNDEVIALYCQTRKEAEKTRFFVRKIINALEPRGGI